jgi:hypothetical protein
MAKPLKAKRYGTLSNLVLDKWFTKGFLKRRRNRKAREFNASVQGLKAERIALKNPDFERTELAASGRRLTKARLAKVSQKRVDRFTRDLPDYKKGGRKERKFKGLDAANRKLSKKRLSRLKLKPKHVKFFSSD